MKKLIPLLLLCGMGCAFLRHPTDQESPLWNVTVPDEVQHLWRTLDHAIQVKDWPTALLCCTTNTQREAAVFRGSMGQFFAPLVDLKISFLWTNMGTERRGDNDSLMICYWITDRDIHPKFPLKKEGGQWRFRIPRREK